LTKGGISGTAKPKITRYFEPFLVKIAKKTRDSSGVFGSIFGKNSKKRAYAAPECSG